MISRANYVTSDVRRHVTSYFTRYFTSNDEVFDELCDEVFQASSFVTRYFKTCGAHCICLPSRIIWCDTSLIGKI